MYLLLLSVPHDSRAGVYVLVFIFSPCPRKRVLYVRSESQNPAVLPPGGSGTTARTPAVLPPGVAVLPLGPSGTTARGGGTTAMSVHYVFFWLFFCLAMRVYLFCVFKIHCLDSSCRLFFAMCSVSQVALLAVRTPHGTRSPNNIATKRRPRGLPHLVCLPRRSPSRRSLTRIRGSMSEQCPPRTFCSFAPRTTISTRGM